MPDVLKMRAVQIRDLALSNGWHFVFKELVFLHRPAIVVEKDLSEIPSTHEVLDGSGLKVVEINETLLADSTYEFSLKRMRLKAKAQPGTGLRRSCACKVGISSSGIRGTGPRIPWRALASCTQTSDGLDSNAGQKITHTLLIFSSYPASANVGYPQRSRTAPCCIFVQGDSPRPMGSTGPTRLCTRVTKQMEKAARS